MAKQRVKTKKIAFLCTAFRDGFQSVFGARVRSKDYLPLIGQAVKAGLTRIEAGGGASFQAAFFYNNENAFDVMDAFRRAAGPDAELQTLSRGVNVVALESQSAALIELHARLFQKHGMTCIRNFDALNDPNNLLFSGRAIQKAGLKHELAVAMMSLPPRLNGAHTPAFYIERLKRFIKAGVPYDSVCFKDASGTATPQSVYETIKQARRLLGEETRLVFHSHETAGTGVACYLAAIEAGADQVDLSLSPVSGGTCQPDAATLWHALRGSSFELDCDIDAVMRLENDLAEALKDYFIPPEALHADPRIPFSPMPGGALTANTQMLRDNKLMDKYGEIIDAMREVVEKGGFGTSVTPVSQFYFQQAFNNVMFGPWKKIADGYGKMVLGYFGTTPVKPDPAVVKAAEWQLKLPPVHVPVLELNNCDPNKSVAHYRNVLAQHDLPQTDENVFIAAACGDKGIAFLKGQGKLQIRLKEDVLREQCRAFCATETAASADAPQRVYVNGQAFDVSFAGQTAVVNGISYDLSTPAAPDAAAPKAQNTPALQPTAAAEPKAGVPVMPGLPGVIARLTVKAGDVVKAGAVVAAVEVMKMETDIAAPIDGRVVSVSVTVGQSVEADTLLMIVEPVQ